MFSNYTRRFRSIQVGATGRFLTLLMMCALVCAVSSAAFASNISDTLVVGSTSKSITAGENSVTITVPFSTQIWTNGLDMLCHCNVVDVVELWADGSTLTVTLTSTDVASFSTNINGDGTSPGYPADANGFIDLTDALEDLLTGPMYSPSGVDLPDIKVLAANCAVIPPPSVPEPASFAMLGLGVALAGLGRCSRLVRRT